MLQETIIHQSSGFVPFLMILKIKEHYCHNCPLCEDTLDLYGGSNGF